MQGLIQGTVENGIHWPQRQSHSSLCQKYFEICGIIRTLVRE
jgi:hypothetical protein